MSVQARFYTGGHHHLDPVMQAEYGGSWPAALGSVVALTGIVLALIPIRRGERWAMWMSLTILAILFVTRIATDPRCLVVLDPHQHGCHSFMIAVLLGVVGLVLARNSRQR